MHVYMHMHVSHNAQITEGLVFVHCCLIQSSGEGVTPSIFENNPALTTCHHCAGSMQPRRQWLHSDLCATVQDTLKSIVLTVQQTSGAPSLGGRYVGIDQLKWEVSRGRADLLIGMH